MDCIWVNLKNVGPPFFKFLSVYILHCIFNYFFNMYIYIFLSVMYIVCVFLFQPRAPVDSRLAIRYLIGLPWVFLNFIFK